MDHPSRSITWTQGAAQPLGRTGHPGSRAAPGVLLQPPWALGSAQAAGATGVSGVSGWVQLEERALGAGRQRVREAQEAQEHTGGWLEITVSALPSPGPAAGPSVGLQEK